MWILLTSIYAIIIGVYNVTRKAAADRSSIFFVLALSSSVGFAVSCFGAAEAVTCDWQGILFFLLKSVIVFAAWVFQLYAFKNYFISSLQPISAIKVLISFVASLLIFNEPVIWWKFFGVAIIFVGLILLNQFERKHMDERYLSKTLQNTEEQRAEYEKLKKRRLLAIIFFTLSCVLNETSGILDKVFMDSYTPAQMQFFFMLFLSVLGWICVFVISIKNRKMIITKKDWGNWLIYLSGILIVVADRLLFTALTYENVLVSAVSIIKQLSTVVSVVFGGLLYKEPNLKYKLIFLAAILVGIVIVLI